MVRHRLTLRLTLGPLLTGALGTGAPDMALEDLAPDANLEDHVDHLLTELRSAYFELFAAIISSGAGTADSTADDPDQDVDTPSKQ